MGGWQPRTGETDPVLAGVDPAGLLAAVAEAEQRGGRWQLEVWRGEHCLVSRRSDEGRPDLFWTWSVSKPFIALLVWQLVCDGVLDADAPVARWWPEFAARGKEAVTLRQVLQHRSGVPTGPGGQAADSLVMANWRWSTHRLAMGAPRWEPGTRSAYHYLSYGFLLGEVVRRATGAELPELMAERIFRPLGMGDTSLGLPKAQQGRAVPVEVTAPGGRLVMARLNSTRVRRAVIPSAGISSTASDIARFYRAALAAQSTLAEVRAVGEPRSHTSGVPHLASAVAEMCVPTGVDGQPDGLLHYPIRLAQGFQLGGPATGWPAVEPFGHLSSRESFGHNGSNACVAWADSANGLIAVYLGSRVRGWQPDRTMIRRLSDALHGAVL